MMTTISPTVEGADYFVAWLRNTALCAGFGFVAWRRYVPYRIFWLGFSIYFAVTGSIPGLHFLTLFYPSLRIVLDYARFFSAWAGLVYAGLFISSIPSILQFLRRRREYGETISTERNDKLRDLKQAGILQSAVMGLTEADLAHMARKYGGF